MNREEIFRRLQPMIAGSLAVDPDEVRMDSRLIDDLGADSLDFVDIIFSIERELGVKVREADFNFLSRLDFSSPTVMHQGFLTAETISRLEPLLPALAGIEEKDRITPGQLFSLLTVESLCLMIERQA